MTSQVNDILLWSIEEAIGSHSQIGHSACGATAVLNALKALHLEHQYGPYEVNCAVGTRLRSYDAGAVEYLRSRSVAGATHEDLINGMDKLFGGLVTSIFYDYDDSDWNENGKFISWCATLMRLGAVLILTLNLQQSGLLDSDGRIADAWHHQMVFGASPQRDSLMLTNPIELAPFENLLRPTLNSESVLRIRFDDVISRIGHEKISALEEDLNELGDRWKELQVSEQVKMLLSDDVQWRMNHPHLIIPAAYHTGVTIIVRKDCEQMEEIMKLIPTKL
jgi:hypothetical protein